MILTGPNMSGKSVFMRQTALLVILAQMGSFIPARAARIGLVDRVLTRVGAQDNVARGQSTFLVEMVETASILANVTPRSLVLLDEVGRGTSTLDGLAIAWAVTEALHDHGRAKVLFATHYHELTALADRLPRVRNFHVAVREWNDEIVFLHKVRPGRHRPVLRHPGGAPGRPARRGRGARQGHPRRARERARGPRRRGRRRARRARAARASSPAAVIRSSRTWPRSTWAPPRRSRPSISSPSGSASSGSGRVGLMGNPA